MRKRHTEEQIVRALRQAESGVPITEICRGLGVSEPTFYRWKKQFVGLGVSDLRELRQLLSVLACKVATDFGDREPSVFARWVAGVFVL